jgi:hypothetical protein
MLIHDGERRYLGDPEEAALRYYRLNFAGASEGSRAVSVPDVNVSLVDVWLQDEAGARVDNVEQGKRFAFHLLVRARQALQGPVFNFHCLNADGHWVFAFSKEVQHADGRPRPVAAGEPLRITAEIGNPLVPGRYSFECWISRSREQGAVAVHILRLLDFVVYGTRNAAGSVTMDGDVRAVVEPVGSRWR